MKVMVVRHGETEGNIARLVQSHTDGILTKAGEAQAIKVAEMLKTEKFDAIYCSNLGRCVQTAGFISSRHPGTPVIYHPKLRERNLGLYEGGSWDNVPWLDYEGVNLAIAPQGGESWINVFDRVAELINELYIKHSDGYILLVTHGGTMKAMKALLESIPMEQVVNGSAPHNGQFYTWQIDRPLTKT